MTPPAESVPPPVEDAELERLLDFFKRDSQLAGIAQQKSATGIGSSEATSAWLDKAEEKRAEIIALVRRRVIEAHKRGGTASLSDSAMRERPQ